MSIVFGRIRPRCLRAATPAVLAMLLAPHCSHAAPQGAAASDKDEVSILDGTRTFMLEAAPGCDVAGSSPTSGGALEVGVEAVRLRVEFEIGTARLTPSATERLERLAATLDDKALTSAQFLITGHTDASGSDAINVPLSCERAKAVRDHLVSLGVDARRLVAVGFGARRRLAGTQPLDAANRRVEIRRLMPRTEKP
jgi:outer membrane protein OmpA-like peptidoglycan-associated protein